MLFETKLWISCTIIVLVEFISRTGADDRAHCPDVVQKSSHFVATYNHTCYMFVNRERFWEEARTDCWRMGGEMLIIPNQLTMNFIKTTLYSRQLRWTNNGVWIGANDLRRSGWEWTTGEKLKYTYWASGEPSQFLGFVSVENCACMRRSDDWRWHDYPCDTVGFRYKYICQFGYMQYRATDTEAVQHDPGTELENSEDFMTVIGLAIGGVALLVLLCSVTYILYRKHEHQKAEAKPPSVRFQNAGYATIMQDISRHDNHSPNNRPPRPTSNVYFDPSEVTRIYDEVNKHSNHGVNFLNNNEAPVLNYTGGATNFDDVDGGYLSAVGTEMSVGSSGYCSSSTQPKQNNDESAYVEMSGTSLNSVEVEYENGSMCSGGADASCASNTPAKDTTTTNTTTNNTTDISDLKPVKPGATGEGTPTHDRQTNVYVDPNSCKSEKEVNQVAPCARDSQNVYVEPSSCAGKMATPPTNLEVEGEMHVYTNSLDLLDTDVQARPLPPIPATPEHEQPKSSTVAVDLKTEK